MPLTTLFAVILLGCSLLSLWIKRDPVIWGTLLCLSVLLGLVAGNITWIGLAFVVGLTVLWLLYIKQPNCILFIALVCLGMSFKFHWIPGFYPYNFTSKFTIGLSTPLVGLFPLALMVPLARSKADWIEAVKGFFVGCIGVALLVILAIATQASRLDFSLPSYMGIRLLSNLVLTCIPEEGFYRGFIQKTLADYMKNTKMGDVFALIITSILFSISHIYWSPNLGIQAFAFLAGLLHGLVYLYSSKIESAIFCHFLFNVIHMVFFSYSAI